MISRNPTLSIAAILVALAMVGCGGDGDGEGGDGQTLTTSSLSRAQFVKRADAACRRGMENILEKGRAYLERNLSKGEPREEWYPGMVEGVLLPAVESQIATVRDLGAPAGDGDRLEAILAAEQEAVDTVAAMDGYREYSDIEGNFEEAADLSRDYGFVACGNGPAAAGLTG